MLVRSRSLHCSESLDAKRYFWRDMAQGDKIPPLHMLQAHLQLETEIKLSLIPLIVAENHNSSKPILT